MAPTRTVSSTGLVLGDQVRCTATLQTPLRASAVTGLTFALRNLTDHPVEVTPAPWNVSFVLDTPDGTTYDTKARLEGISGPGRRLPTTIAPGATTTETATDVRVRWAEPVSITPVCVQTSLRPLHADVVAPGPAPTEPEAIAEVVATSGHLLDGCRPISDGVSVLGWIDPPSGDAPSMPAECSISVRRQGPFLVAQAVVRVPPGLKGVEITAPYEQVSLPESSGTVEAIVWDFVVTAEGAIPVDSTTVDKTRPADAMAPEREWTGTRWEGPGGSRCGGYVTAGGGTDGGAMIEFVSVCPS